MTSPHSTVLLLAEDSHSSNTGPYRMLGEAGRGQVPAVHRRRLTKGCELTARVPCLGWGTPHLTVPWPCCPFGGAPHTLTRRARRQRFPTASLNAWGMTFQGNEHRLQCPLLQMNLPRFPTNAQNRVRHKIHAQWMFSERLNETG